MLNPVIPSICSAFASIGAIATGRALWLMGRLVPLVLLAVLGAVLLAKAALADVTPFVGRYAGSVETINSDGSVEARDMSVSIDQGRYGFLITWSTVSLREDGTRKEKTYEVRFVESDRSGIYAAAMERNVFGHAVQMDPMKGQPYVWGRITGKTLTVFSMFIAPNGDYEMQQYDRTLADGGLDLRYVVHRNGAPTRTVSTFLKRVD